MKKILIADDSNVVRDLLSKTLRAKGYDVIECVDGEAAWTKIGAEAKAPDLCLFDVNMPKLSGIELCQKIRSEPRFKELPILMITAQSSPNLKQQAKDLGVRAWVLKPVMPELVLSVVEKVLGGS